MQRSFRVELYHIMKCTVQWKWPGNKVPCTLDIGSRRWAVGFTKWRRISSTWWI